uniref:Uncharacterized protein n=1 Tax=Rhizophora mucronata TaxID=61149 RepID=A0A2P2Q955_RHIMU
MFHARLALHQKHCSISTVLLIHIWKRRGPFS